MAGHPSGDRYARPPVRGRSQSREVYVVAHGARTPVGLTGQSSAAAVRAGICRHSVHPFLLDGHGEPIVLARDGVLEAEMLGAARLAVLCRNAQEEALAKILRGNPLGRPLPMLMALPELRPGFTAAAIEDVLSSLRAPILDGRQQVDVELVGRGHAGGLQAFDIAVRRIAAGATEVCLVGGGDSYCEPATLEWLEETQQLKTGHVRGGFIPGEGAGVIVLASRAGCREMGLPPLASVRGVGSATETKLIRIDDVNVGEGLVQALSIAMGAVGAPAEAPDEVYCDINGERYRSEEWGFAVLRAHQLLRSGAYHAPADCWGDVGAASGPLLCILAVQAWLRRYAVGPRALIWCGSEGGLRSSVVLETTQQMN